MSDSSQQFTTKKQSLIRSVTPPHITPETRFKFVENSNSDNTSKLKFGLKKSKPDEREKYFSFFTYENVPLPLQFCPEKYSVFDQGNINSCSANSVSNKIKL